MARRGMRPINDPSHPLQGKKRQTPRILTEAKICGATASWNGQTLICGRREHGTSWHEGTGTDSHGYPKDLRWPNGIDGNTSSHVEGVGY